MAVRSREIGWSEEEILEWQIEKQLYRLSVLRCCTSETTTATPGDLLLEDGFNMLLENGDNISLE